MSACPRCLDTGLKHTLISETLPAHTCPSCSGMSISLVAYRHWRETHKVESQTHPERGRLSPVEDTENAIKCRKCRSLMTKFRISADVPNRIDFCASCEDIWLDEGEWALVEALAGSDHLANIITQPWQRKVRMESAENMQVERLKSVFGDDYEKVVELRDWLSAHPRKDEVFAYLRRKDH